MKVPSVAADAFAMNPLTHSDQGTGAASFRAAHLSLDHGADWQAAAGLSSNNRQQSSALCQAASTGTES